MTTPQRLYVHKTSIGAPLSAVLDTANPSLTVGGTSPAVEIVASTTSAPKTVIVYGSYDGIRFFQTDTFTLTPGNPIKAKFYDNAFRYVKAEIATPGAHEIVIVAADGV